MMPYATETPNTFKPKSYERAGKFSNIEKIEEQFIDLDDTT